MDAMLLARLQFAFQLSFHILFPTLNIGLAGLLVLFEAQWLRTSNPVFYHLCRFLTKIFALAFGAGVVTGITLSFMFGTNFSKFSLATGNVLGPLMSYEVLTAFFLEATFLGVMLFGWSRVSPRLHFLSACVVFTGTLISSFWIIAANSWMHTPAGHIFKDGKFFTRSWMEVIFTPSFPYRLSHMVLASGITACFVVAGIFSWYLLKCRHQKTSKIALSYSLGVATILVPLQLMVGHFHGLLTVQHQPLKVAAIEGHWETHKGAPLILFAIPDEKNECNKAEISIPRLGSLIVTHKWDGEVKGLKSVPPKDRPPVAVVFYSFRIMVGIGFLFLLTLLWSFILKQRRSQSPVFLRWCVLMSPLGFVATLCGWYVTEVGRQPWIVYGLMRTADSASSIPAATILASLLLYLGVYTAVGVAFLYYFFKYIRTGPLPSSLPPTMSAIAYGEGY